MNRLKNLPSALLLALAASGCSEKATNTQSGPPSQYEISSCISTIELTQEVIKKSERHNKLPEVRSRADAEHQASALWYAMLEETKAVLREGKELTRIKAILATENICRIPIFADPYFLQSTEWANDSSKQRKSEPYDPRKEFDEAQMALLADYAKTAKRHQISTRNGVRIDTFVFEGGKTIICSTTVRNNARAVSCD